jgi:phosphoribosylanthranilate isomerase
MALWIKICGVTSVEDALAALEAGADAIGVNFVPSSKRYVELGVGRAIRDAVGDRAEVVGVVADRPLGELALLRERTGIDWLQLHGNETTDAVRALLPCAYKAIRIGTALDAADARGVPGERLLVDAKVEGELGGTGRTFDWKLVTGLAAERPLVLAGGLTAENVAEAVRTVRPFGVDVAGGVESKDPRRKDPERLDRFIRAARGARENPPLG